MSLLDQSPWVERLSQSFQKRLMWDDLVGGCWCGWFCLAAAFMGTGLFDPCHSAVSISIATLWAGAVSVLCTLVAVL